jgi:hypothetical protein
MAALKYVREQADKTKPRLRMLPNMIGDGPGQCGPAANIKRGSRRPAKAGSRLPAVDRRTTRPTDKRPRLIEVFWLPIFSFSNEIFI